MPVNRASDQKWARQKNRWHILQCEAKFTCRHALHSLCDTWVRVPPELPDRCIHLYLLCCYFTCFLCAARNSKGWVSSVDQQEALELMELHLEQCQRVLLSINTEVRSYTLVCSVIVIVHGPFITIFAALPSLLAHLWTKPVLLIVRNHDFVAYVQSSSSLYTSPLAPPSFCSC